jgi:DNA-binding XRE family transcriptional regulator
VRRTLVPGDPKRDYASEWRRWRKAHGMTQAQMASVLRLSLKTIINIEHGYNRPSVTSRTKLEQLKKKYMEAQA